MKLTINGREFEVTVSTMLDPDRRRAYELRGKRGASYYTMRNVPNPDLMFVVNVTFTKSTGLEGVWLTDKNGVLEVVR